MVKSAYMSIGYYHPKATNVIDIKKVVKYPISFVIPISSIKYRDRLKHCLKSIRAQVGVDQNFVDIVVVCLANKPESIRALLRVVRQFRARVVYHCLSFDVFPLSLARNTGAAHACWDTLCFVDADMVLDRETIYRAAECGNVFTSVWASYMNERYNRYVVTGDDIAAFRKVARNGIICPKGYGGFLLVSKDVFNTIGGYDEVYDQGWGVEDNDIVDRLHAWGLEHGYAWKNLSYDCGILSIHQWHPVKDHAAELGVIANREYYNNTNTIVRNIDARKRPVFVELRNPVTRKLRRISEPH